MSEPQRCPWADPGDALYLAYHDDEWGVPLHDERALFELLALEGFQAGLSWRTILHKRAAFRRALDGFRAERLARWGAERVARALLDPAIVRHRGKIEAAVANAQAVLALHDGGETLDAFVWRSVGGEPIVNAWRRSRDVPARTAESEELSRALRARGFAFVGPTTCYAFMQAAGLVNDHVVGCFLHPFLHPGRARAMRRRRRA